MPRRRPARAISRLFIAKDEHKFSCAHMTIFADGSKERLHGHNYHVACAVEMDGASRDGLLEFALIKQALTSLCTELREHLLVPASHPQVEVVAQSSDEIELRICARRYVLPSDEVLLLPVRNLVVEELAELLWDRLVERLAAPLRQAGVVTLEVTVTESPGQGATYRADLLPLEEPA